MSRVIPYIVICLSLMSASTVQAGWFDRLSEMLNQGNGTENSGVLDISDAEITRAFKEALAMGSEKVVSQLSVIGGFNDDARIRIPLPEKLQQAKSLMQQVGMEKTLSDLELRLNRAAEDATPKAKKLFTQAIKEITFADVRAIYKGPDDSATQYFKRKMTAGLSREMEPVISDSLSKVGALESYDKMISAYKTIPFVPDLKADLTQHVIDGALSGIFHYLAKQEAAIRNDPVLQTTALLKKVFGQ